MFNSIEFLSYKSSLNSSLVINSKKTENAVFKWVNLYLWPDSGLWLSKKAASWRQFLTMCMLFYKYYIVYILVKIILILFLFWQSRRSLGNWTSFPLDERSHSTSTTMFRKRKATGKFDRPKSHSINWSDGCFLDFGSWRWPGDNRLSSGENNFLQKSTDGYEY